MKYTVISGSHAVAVEIDGATVRVGGRVWQATLQRVPGTPLAVLHTERGLRTAICRPEGDGWMVGLAGSHFSFQVLDERALAAREVGDRQSARWAGGVVRAPMPGMVLRLEVTSGDVVQAGTGLVVLEAMKMENEIRSPGSATVASVLVIPGQTVEKGAPLIELAPQG